MTKIFMFALMAIKIIGIPSTGFPSIMPNTSVKQRQINKRKNDTVIYPFTTKTTCNIRNITYYLKKMHSHFHSWPDEKGLQKCHQTASSSKSHDQIVPAGAVWLRSVLFASSLVISKIPVIKPYHKICLRDHCKEFEVLWPNSYSSKYSIATA